jgi:fucose permease
VAIALFGLAWLWADPGGWGAVGLPIAGLGLAPIFPTLVTLTPHRIGRDRSTHSIGYQLAAATVGGSAIPWVIGLVGERAGFQALAASIFLVCVLLAIVVLVSEREARIPDNSGVPVEPPV